MATSKDISQNWRVVRLGLYAFLVFFLFALLQVQASEEEAMALASFALQSNGVDSGPVSVSGTQDVTGITALTVKAFGKNYILTNAQLQQVKGMIINGIQLSGEGGYPGQGGRVLYIQISMGFTSGLYSSRLITLKERGDITIGLARSR